MNCRDIRTHIHAWLDDELDTATNLRVLDHVEACSACRERFDSEARVRARYAEVLRSGGAPMMLREHLLGDGLESGRSFRDRAPQAGRPAKLGLRVLPWALAAAAATLAWIGFASSAAAEKASEVPSPPSSTSARGGGERAAPSSPSSGPLSFQPVSSGPLAPRQLSDEERYGLEPIVAIGPRQLALNLGLYSDDAVADFPEAALGAHLPVLHWRRGPTPFSSLLLKAVPPKDPGVLIFRVDAHLALELPPQKRALSTGPDRTLLLSRDPTGRIARLAFHDAVKTPNRADVWFLVSATPAQTEAFLQKLLPPR